MITYPLGGNAMSKPETEEEIRKAEREVFLARVRLFLTLFGVFGIPILFVFALKYVS